MVRTKVRLQEKVWWPCPSVARNVNQSSQRHQVETTKRLLFSLDRTRPSQKTDVQQMIKYMEFIFRMHGLPLTVRSDNVPPFASMEFEGFQEYLGIGQERCALLAPKQRRSGALQQDLTKDHRNRTPRG